MGPILCWEPQALAQPDPPELRAFRLAHDTELDREIARAAVAWALDPWLLKALLQVESRMSPRAVNRRTDAVGIAQLTRGGRAAVSNLRRRRGAPPLTRAQALDPAEAIPAAAELLEHLVELCGDEYRGLGAYGSGTCGRARGFVLTVVRVANRMRIEAGLPPLPGPNRARARTRRVS